MLTHYGEESNREPGAAVRQVGPVLAEPRACPFGIGGNQYRRRPKTGRFLCLNSVSGCWISAPALVGAGEVAWTAIDAASARTLGSRLLRPCSAPSATAAPRHLLVAGELQKSRVEDHAGTRALDTGRPLVAFDRTTLKVTNDNGDDSGTTPNVRVRLARRETTLLRRQTVPSTARAQGRGLGTRGSVPPTRHGASGEQGGGSAFGGDRAKGTPTPNPCLQNPRTGSARELLSPRRGIVGDRITPLS